MGLQVYWPTASVDLQDAGVELEMHCQMSYEDVEAKLAQHIGLADPHCLRFTAHNVFSQVWPYLILMPQTSPVVPIFVGR